MNNCTILFLIKVESRYNLINIFSDSFGMNVVLYACYNMVSIKRGDQLSMITHLAFVRCSYSFLTRS